MVINMTASYFHPQKMADGTRAAHGLYCAVHRFSRRFRVHSWHTVRNPKTGRSVRVQVRDCGCPIGRIDLSVDAAKRIIPNYRVTGIVKVKVK